MQELGRVRLRAARFGLAIVAALGAFALLAPSASASLSVGPPQVLASPTDPDNGFIGVGAPAQIVYATDGSATVVYGDTGSDVGIKWLRVAADGTPGPVHALSSDYTFDVRAVIDSNGVVTAAWLGGGTLNTVRILADGSTSAVNTIGPAGSFDLVVDGNDRVTATWTYFGAPVAATRFKADGTVDYASQPIATATDSAGAVDAAVESGGRLQAVWYAQVGGTWETRTVRVAPDGTPGATEILGSSGSNPTSPRVIIISDSIATAVWSQVDGGGGANDLMATRISSAGTPSSPLLLVDGAGSNNPDIVGDGTGTTVAVSGTNLGGDPTLYVIRLAYDGSISDSRTIGPLTDLGDAHLTIDPTHRVTVHFFANAGDFNQQRALRISPTGKFGRLVHYDGPATGSFATAPDGEFVALGGYGARLQIWHGATVDPETTIDSGPAGSTNDSTPTFAFSSDEEATFECKVDSGSYGPCSSPETLAQLSDGEHTFSVRATDGEGITDSTPASSTFTVSTATPETTITSGPADGSATSDNTPTFGFTSSALNATFECSIDSTTNYSSCGSPTTFGPLSEGQHVFRVRSIDEASNVDPTPAARTFTVDRTPPTTTITSGPAAGSTVDSGAVAFAFSSNETGATFACSVDGAAFTPCTSPNAVNLADGQHDFRARAVDAAGNYDASPEDRTFTVATKTAPPPDTSACDKAKAKLDKAKSKLKKAKKSGSKPKVKKAKAAVKGAKAGVKAAC